MGERISGCGTDCQRVNATNLQVAHDLARQLDSIGTKGRPIETLPISNLSVRLARMNTDEPARPADITTARLELAKVNGQFSDRLQKLLGGPAFENMPPNVVSIWRSSKHIVTLHQHDHCQVLEIRRTVLTDDFEFEADPMTWNELMQVKSEIGLGDAWCVECYPPEKHSLQKMRSRCLWLMGDDPDFGWRIIKPDTEKARLNGHSLDLPPVDDGGMPGNVAEILMGRARLIP